MAETAGGRAAPDLSLVYADVQGRPRIFTIPEGTTTLGRAGDNDLVLDDPSVSPHQVVLMRRGEAIELRDLFAGETKVNDQPVRAGRLEAGDTLMLGTVRLRVMKVVSRRSAAFPRGAAGGPSSETQRLGRSAAPRQDPEAPTKAHQRPTGLFSRAAIDAARGEAPTTADASGAHTRPISDRHARPARTSDRLQPGSAGHRRPAPSDRLPAVDSPMSGAKRAPDGGPSTDAFARPRPADAPAAREQPRADPSAAALAEARAALERRDKTIARARQLSEEMLIDDDFEVILERIALAFLEIFAADRGVTVLLEEDGRNPLLTVERRRDGTDEGAGVAQEIIDRCLQVRSVIRVAGGHQGLGGLAAPLLSKGKAVGLLYFERTTAGGPPIDASDVHLMGMLTNQAALVIAPLVR